MQAASKAHPAAKEGGATAKKVRAQAAKATQNPNAKEGGVDAKRATKREKSKLTVPSFDFSWPSIKAWWLAHPVVLGSVVAIIFLLVMLYPPTCSYYAALRTNQALSEQLSDVTTERDELQSDVTKLTSEDGIKDEARRRGYVDEGDTAVDMQGIEDSGSAASDATVLEQQNAEEQKETPWYFQALDVIFQYDAETQGVG